MQEPKTDYLKLTLPHEDNLLEDDVFRIKDAFRTVDNYAENNDKAFATHKAEAEAALRETSDTLNQTINTNKAAADAALNEAVTSLTNTINTNKTNADNALATHDAKHASSTVGHVALASDAEVNAGTISDKALSPRQLKNYTASAIAPKADTSAVNAALSAALNALIPRGIITMWCGDAGNIPSGWALCNGQNGTPNLLNRFVVAAGSGYGAHWTGGSTNHGHSAWSDGRQPGVYTDSRQPGVGTDAQAPGVTVDNHTLSTSEMPYHTHGMEYLLSGIGYGSGLANDINYDGVFTISGVNTSKSGGNFSHSHNARVNAHSHGAWQDPHNHGAWQDAHDHGIGVGAVDILPPYYALCYIMKL